MSSKRSRRSEAVAATFLARRTRLADLSKDILSNVFSRLYYPSLDKRVRKQSIQDLQSISVVCKAFVDSAQHWLFRHLDITIDTSSGPALQRLVERLLSIRDKRFAVRSLSITPKFTLDQLGKAILGTVLRSFLEAPSVHLENLVLELPSWPWGPFILETLTGFTSKLKRMASSDSYLAPANAVCVRQLLSASPLCNEIVYLYGTQSAMRPQAAGLCVREHQMISSGGVHHIEKIVFAQLGDPVPFVGRFSSSVFMGLSCLEIDPITIQQITTSLRGVKIYRNHISTISISPATDTTRARLTDMRKAGKDPRSWLGEMISLCPELKDLRLSLPCCSPSGKPWSLASLPKRLISLSITFEAESFPALFLTGWPDFLKHLAAWLSQCHKLPRCSITIPSSCWIQSMSYALCGMDPKIWLSPAEQCNIGSEAMEVHASDCLRYPYGTHEIDEDIIQDLQSLQRETDLDDSYIPDHVVEYIEERGFDILAEKIMLECRKQARVIRRSLNNAGIQYILEVPDFVRILPGQLSM